MNWHGVRLVSRGGPAALLAALSTLLTFGLAAASTSGNWQLGARRSASTVGAGASMAYDAATGQLLMFGGLISAGGLSNQTWQWTGKGWSLLRPTVSPPPRMHGSMAYDPATRQLILSGGWTNSANGPVLTDTWNWTGTSWAELSPATTPESGYGASMAYDPVARNLVRFGGNVGYGDATTSDTYVWNGSDWSKLSPPPYPDRPLGLLHGLGCSDRPIPAVRRAERTIRRVRRRVGVERL